MRLAWRRVRACATCTRSDRVHLRRSGQQAVARAGQAQGLLGPAIQARTHPVRSSAPPASLVRRAAERQRCRQRHRGQCHHPCCSAVACRRVPRSYGRCSPTFRVVHGACPDSGVWLERRAGAWHRGQVRGLRPGNVRYRSVKAVGIVSRRLYRTITTACCSSRSIRGPREQPLSIRVKLQKARYYWV